MADKTDFRFVASLAGTPNLADDPRLALMAACVANQQRAGFGSLIDIRQFTCPGCKSAGFNTGWGCVEFVCGAEAADDEMMTTCPQEAPPASSISEERPHG